VYSRLAGHEDVNDAHQLSVDPVIRAVTGKKKTAASVNTIGRFETEILSLKKNLKGLSEINGRWVEKAMKIRLICSSLVQNMRINPSILQNTVLGMNYKPLESRIYSFVVLIWEYLFLFRCEQKLFVNGHILLKKHSKIPGGNIGIFFAVICIQRT
jgi:hypothetical protein